MITQVQQAEIARILGYPNLSPMSSLQAHYPYFSSQLAMWQPYAMLLNRLSQAAPYDEVQYLGAESALFGQFFTPAQVQLQISSPNGISAGALIQFNLGGQMVSYTTQNGDTPASVAKALSQQIAQTPALSTQFMPTPNGSAVNLFYIAALGTDGNGINCIATSSDPSVLLTFGAATASQGAFGATAGGAVPPGPQYTPQGETNAVFGYVPIIHTLESDLINARVNLDTLKTAKWSPRQDELSVRYALLRQYRKELADRLSVPLDPDIAGNTQQNTQRIV